MGTAALFNSPEMVAISGGGVVYVTDFYNGLIRSVSPTGVVATLAGHGNDYDSPDGVGTSAGFSCAVGVTVTVSGTVLN